jgi:predicted MFS family arabinose efflux permease
METQVTPPKATLNVFHTKTRAALLWMNLSNEPFIVLYALLAFILRKEMHASLLQISILSALRPVLPLFSFYWSANLSNQKNRLRLNLVGAWALARAPFLLVPWIHNVWYLIFCCAIYELFNKSGIPALIEILKINIPKEAREKTYTLYFVISFLESILLGVFIAGILEYHRSSWQILCCCTALLSLSSILLQIRVPIALEPVKAVPRLDFKERIIKPWKEAFFLLKTRTDFAHFQYGFMIGGFGLMLIAPSLAFFYVDHLRLSHSNIVTGRSILMGIGVVLSSYFWRKALAKRTVAELTFWILMGFALYPLLMVFALNHIGWFYLSFICYGIAQAGSHLVWNLSGTLFAIEEDSSPYSRVNILMLGLRGAIAPALGGFCCDLFGPVFVLITGAAICASGVLFMRKNRRFQETRGNCKTPRQRKIDDFEPD